MMSEDHFVKFQKLVQECKNHTTEHSFYSTLYFQHSKNQSQIQTLLSGEITSWKKDEEPGQISGSLKFLSEPLSDSFFEKFQNVYYQSTLDGIITDISPAVKHFSGYSREELIGKPTRMFYQNPEVREFLLNELEKHGRVQDYKLKLVSADEKIFHVLVNASVTTDENGNPNGIEGVLSNITEKVEAQSELQDTRFFFNQIVSNTSDGIFVCNNDLVYTYWNPAMERITGLKSKDVVGKSSTSLFPHSKKQSIHTMLQKALDGTPTETDDYFYKVPQTGNTGWAQSTYVPRKNKQGEIVGLIGTVQEISDRKKTEQKLRESDKTLSELSEQIPGGMYQLLVSHDWSASFKYASKGFARIADLTEVKILEDANNVFDIIHPDDWENFRQSIRSSYKKLEDWTVEFRIKLQDGSVRWLHTNARPEKQDQDSILWHGYIEDITARKEAEVAAMQFQKQFEAIFNNVPNIIFVKDADDKFLMVNKAAAEYYNTPQEQLIGNKDSYSGLAEHIVNRIHEADERVLEKNETVFLPENESVTDDGKVYWHQAQKVPFTLPGTGKKTVLTIITDVTLRKQKEEELLESLAIVNDQNKRLLNFAHIVTHNLRNHIGNISMLLSLYKMEDSDSEKEELIDLLHSASKGLKDSVEDLIDIVELRSQQEKKMESIPVLQYSQKIKEILKTEIDRNDINFILDVPETLTIQYIPAYLESILLNLASNAVKYSDPEKDSFVKISAQQTDSGIRLTVEDNGMGMDLDKYGDKVFGLYNTFHDNENSKGIGLFITKEQVESLGGSITVQSKAGEGTVFTVVLRSQNK